MKRFRSWLGVFLIFAFGVFVGLVLGAGGVYGKLRAMVERGPDQVVDVIVSKLRHDLHLDAQQEEMLHHIVLDTSIQLSAIRQQTEPQVDQALSDAEGKVRGILHPNQIAKFDEIVSAGREKWRRKETHPN